MFVLDAIISANFTVPIWFDVTAVFLGAVAGAITGVQRGYDIVGVVTLGLINGSGGGLLRDVIVNTGPPVLLTHNGLLLAVGFGVFFGIVYERHYSKYVHLFSSIDTLSIIVYAFVGSIKGIDAGLAIPGVVILGTINAIGGSLLRDVMCREEPLLFKPGQFYTLVAALSSALFVILVRGAGMATLPAALVVLPIGFLLRVFSVRRNWRTRPFRSREDAGSSG